MVPTPLTTEKLQILLETPALRVPAAQSLPLDSALPSPKRFLHPFSKLLSPIFFTYCRAELATTIFLLGTLSDPRSRGQPFPSQVPSSFTLLFHVNGNSPGRFEGFLRCRTDVTSTVDLSHRQREEAGTEPQNTGAFRKQPPRLPNAKNVSRAAPS
jgi:hypothetical protein